MTKILPAKKLFRQSQKQIKTKTTLQKFKTIAQIQEINIRESGNQKWTIHRNWQHMVHKTQKNKTNTQYPLNTTIDHYTQANTNNVNKT